MSTQQIIPLLNQIINTPVPLSQINNLQPADYISAGEVNQSQFGSTISTPLTSQNLGQVDIASTTTNLIISRLSGNIGVSGNMATIPSGYWRCSQIITDTNYSRVESHTFSSSGDINSAMNALNQLATARAKLLGNKYNLSIRRE